LPTLPANHKPPPPLEPPPLAASSAPLPGSTSVPEAIVPEASGDTPKDDGMREGGGKLDAAASPSNSHNSADGAGGGASGSAGGREMDGATPQGAIGMEGVAGGVDSRRAGAEGGSMAVHDDGRGGGDGGVGGGVATGGDESEGVDASGTELTGEEDEVALRRYVVSHPTDLRGHAGLGKLLLRQRRWQEAVEFLWPLVQSLPREQSAPLRFQLALSLLQQGQHAAAEALLSQVLVLEPSFVEARLCLVSCLEAQGKLGEAVESLRQAAELRPEVAPWAEREASRLLAGSGAVPSGDPRAGGQ